MIKKKQIFKVFITAAIIFTMIFSSITAVVADNLLSDIKGHWAQDAIEDLVNEGIIEGYPDGTFRPNNNITRAEFTSLLVRAFGLESGPGKVFSDTAGHWAKDYIRTANYHGLVNGYSDTLFGPDDPVTREQIAAMVVNATKAESVDESKIFTDSTQISTWAREPVTKAAAAGLITGYPDGTFKPKANATRAEAAVILDRSMKVAIGEETITTFDIAGTYGPGDGIETIETDVIINANGVILQNTVIKGNLTISEKVGDGDVTLNNVTVKGTTLVYGGGKDSIHINGGQYNNIIIEGTPGGNVRIVAVDAKGIKIVISEEAAGEEIVLEGTFESVEIKSSDIVLSTRGKTDIDKIKVDKNLSGIRLNIDKDTTINGFTLDSATRVKNAKDTIKKIDGDKAPDSNIDNPPKEETPSSGGGGYTPPGKTVDKNKLEAAIDEALGLEEEDYTAEGWENFAVALVNAQEVLIDEKATQEEVDAVLADLNVAIAKLVGGPVTYFDELWDAFANTVNTQAQKTDPKERVTVQFDAKNKHINMRIHDNYHTKDIISIAFGTGLNTAVLNLLRSEKVIKINSAGHEVRTLDEHGNKKEKDDLRGNALDVAFAWLGDNERGTPMEEYLIGETIDFVLYGELNDEKFSVPYIIYFY